MGVAFHLVDHFQSNVVKKKFVAETFIEKAFDTLEFRPIKLVLNLNQVGLSHEAAALMSSYLMSRQTATTINGMTSSVTKVKFGVPKGSILGPLLFITYMNDLSSCAFKGELMMYADDAVLAYACDSWSDTQQVAGCQHTDVER